GPSAGGTMTTALVLLLTGRRGRAGLALEGEGSLTGRGLPVGGGKGEGVAAPRAGGRSVVDSGPYAQEFMEGVAGRGRDEMTIHLVDAVPDLLKHALEDTPTWSEVERMALSS